MESRPPQIVELHNLSCGYKVGNNKTAVVNTSLNLSVSEGELIAVIGPNGIGKSTLLKTIANLIPPIEGHVSILGKELRQLSLFQLATTLSFVSTEKYRIPHLLFYDLVAMGRHPYTNWWGTITKQDDSIISQVVEMVNASHLMHSYLDQLSDGEKQKAYIARALAQQTDLMLLDEPTAFLDISAKYTIVSLLSKLTRTAEKAILFSTHDLEIALAFADKIWLLIDQNIISGAPEDLILQGHFHNLLGDAGLSFDKETGKIIQQKPSLASVFLSGEGDARLWTEKALQRIGVAVSKSPSNLPVVTLKRADKKWLWDVKYKKSQISCNSLYELCVFLKKHYLV